MNPYKWIDEDGDCWYCCEVCKDTFQTQDRAKECCVDFFRPYPEAPRVKDKPKKAEAKSPDFNSIYGPEGVNLTSNRRRK